MKSAAYRDKHEVACDASRTAQKKTGLVQRFACNVLVAGAMLLPVAACDNGAWDSPTPYRQRAHRAESPKTESVRKLAKIISDAGADREMVSYAVQTANSKSDEKVQWMVEFSQLMADLGMRGGDIYDVLIQVEDPWPSRTFTVGRAPNSEQTARLDSLLQRAILLFGCTDPSCGRQSYGYGYTPDALTLTWSVECRQ